MKILVLQLARLGDLFLSWPALRALRRKYPDAQIEVLTRSRFQEALRGCDAISKIRILDTTAILGPLIGDEPNIPEAFKQTENAVHELKAESYDWIVNFSFSPASSYLTSAIAGKQTQISGYTRSSDGYLAIPDDMSAYFYAQVGPGKSNRFHLAEIFGTMVDMDLAELDWAPPSFIKAPARTREGIVIHVGASEAKKSISPAKWSAVINQIRKFSDQHIFLIGAKHERALAEKILDSVPTEQVKNLVGETSLEDTFRLISHSAVLIGCDSAPIHMASLTQTPCLNLSLASVNFWETGPRSPRSFVLKASSEEDLPSDKVAGVVQKIVENQSVDVSVITGLVGTPSFRALLPRDQEFQWNLINAIYRGEEFPESPDQNFSDALEKLSDVNQLMIEQMQFISGGGDLQKVAGIINRGEEIIQTIAQLSPNLSPLIRWYQTEKLRIGPASGAEVLAKTLEIHQLLAKALALYQSPEFQTEEVL
jgi:ADP-heptose:LPS heptosyltransferase